MNKSRTIPDPSVEPNTSKHRVLDKDIKRKAKSILRKLQGEGCILAPMIEAQDQQHGPVTYHLTQLTKTISRNQKPASSVIKVEHRVLQVFLAQQWIEPLLETWDNAHKSYRLSSMGKAWLKRNAAEYQPFQEQHHSLTKRIRKVPHGQQQTVIVNDSESPL